MVGIMPWIVDGNNVMGSRPDGWWRDRPAAMQRLLDDLAGTEALVVFDGRDRPLEPPPGITVAFAPVADDEIAARARPGDTVVTSDAGLAERVRAAGAEVV